MPMWLPPSLCRSCFSSAVRQTEGVEDAKMLRSVALEVIEWRSRNSWTHQTVAAGKSTSLGSDRHTVRASYAKPGRAHAQPLLMDQVWCAGCKPPPTSATSPSSQQGGSSAGGIQMKNVSGAWRAFCVSVLGVLLAVSTGGCVLDAASTYEPGKQPVDGEVASTSQAIASTNVKQWSQGSPPTLLSSDTSNTVCFLQSMRGRFKGMGEAVRVAWIEFADASHSVPGWYLEGNSQQAGVNARARCISVPWVHWSWEFSWGAGLGSSPNGDVDLGIQKACFLTRIEGDFEGAGEQLRLVKTCDSGTNTCRWTFTGKYGSPGGIRGGAICINPPDMEDADWPTEYVPTYQGPLRSASLTLAWRVPADRYNLTTGAACFLTFVQGKFMGDGEEVRVTKNRTFEQDGVTPLWFYALDIWKQQPGVGGGGTCVY
jgi:hypothetical protein